MAGLGIKDGWAQKEIIYFSVPGRWGDFPHFQYSPEPSPPCKLVELNPEVKYVKGEPWDTILISSMPSSLPHIFNSLKHHLKKTFRESCVIGQLILVI